jgi:hypothetical protein
MRLVLPITARASTADGCAAEDHRGVPEPGKAAVHTIGQTARFAHFPVKPRREAAAPQNMIDDIRGHEIRIVARDALPAERDHRLRHVDIDHDTAAKSLRCRVGDRLEIVFLRQRAERTINERAGRLGIDVPDD